MYHYAGNNPIRYIDPNGREDEIKIESYEPQEKTSGVNTVSKTLVPSANKTQKTANQNKEQKAIWAEGTIIDEQNEYSCNMSSGLYRVSSELNDSVADGHIVAQGQMDIMTGDFNCEITDTGAGASFGVNMASASGTIGLQKKIKNRNFKATVSGSVGINFGGGIQFDLDRGIKLDIAFILGGSFEISWRKRK